MKMIKEKNIFAAVCFMLFLLPATALAHPESHDMPDAVAETEYKIAIDLNPDDIVTRNKLGNLLYASGRFNEAAEQFKSVLRLRPDDFDAHYGMGLVEKRKGRYKEAVIWLEKAERLKNIPEVMIELKKLEQLLDEKR
jgi:tetratricopeptide (TPR) repeat protein